MDTGQGNPSGCPDRIVKAGTRSTKVAGTTARDLPALKEMRAYRQPLG